MAIDAFNPGMMETHFAPATRTRQEVEEIKARMPEHVGDLDLSAKVLADLVSSPNFDGISGAYIDRDRGATRSSELSYDLDHQRELWEASCRFTQLTVPFCT